MSTITKFLTAVFVYLKKKLLAPTECKIQPNPWGPQLILGIDMVAGLAEGFAAAGVAAEGLQRAYEIFMKSMQHPIKCPINNTLLKAEHYAKNSKRLRIRMKYTKRLARCHARR